MSVINTVEEYWEVIQRARQADEICYDLETQGLNWELGDRLVGVALLIPEEDQLATFYIPFRHTDPNAPFERWKLEYSEKNLPLEQLRDLNQLFVDPDRSTVGHNLAFDMHFTRVDNVKPPQTPIDTQLGAHLVDENHQSKLEALAQDWIIENSEFSEFHNRLPENAADEEDAVRELVYERVKERRGKKPKKSTWKRYLAILEPEEVAPYAENDVLLSYLLRSYVKQELEEDGLLDLWYECCEYLKPCYRMEKYGVLIDREYAKRNLRLARKKAEELEGEAQEITGIDDFNPNSPVQVCDYLDLESSRKEILKKLGHPLAPVVLEYRQWSRACNTYFKPYLEQLDENSRVHSRLNTTGTISSRLSSSRPNLQALPKKKDNYKVRDVVTAPPGYVLLSADYSQAELRLLAHYTESGVLMDVYQNDKDLHSETAEQIGVPRRIAKRINYGIVYGLTAHGLRDQEDLDITLQQAEQYLNQYHERIPEIRKVFKMAERIAQRNGYIEFWTGRRRHYENRWQCEKALSNLIQGGVAEIMRVAITRLYHQLRHTNARMVLQVHDELLFEVPTKELDYHGPQIQDTMENFNFKVPIKVDTAVGESWASKSLEEVDFRDSA